MNFIQRNVFKKLRIQYFNSKESLETMTHYKLQKLNRLLDNVKESSTTEAEMTNPFLHKKFIKIQTDEHHSIDTSVETIYLLRIIVINVQTMLNLDINLKGIIQIGQYLRTRGDKVDFVKLETWLRKLHISRIAQLQGSILILFFGFEMDEIPFVHHIEKDAYKMTLKALHQTVEETTREWKFQQSEAGLVHTTNGTFRKNINHCIRYFKYAPIESTSNFLHNFTSSLSEIEE